MADGSDCLEVLFGVPLSVCLGRFCLGLLGSSSKVL